MLRRGEVEPHMQLARCAIGAVLLALLTGCATDGGHATLRESPDTLPARKESNEERDALERALTQGCLPRDGEPPPISPAATLAEPARIVLVLSSSSESGDPFGQANQGYNVPGRTPGSQMPWEFFLGNAAHRLIAYMYGVNHPGNRVFYNNQSIVGILRRTDLGDSSRLTQAEQELRPDITDIAVLQVFEIKPRSAQGLQEGRQKVAVYLAALNRAGAPETIFSGGIGFHGEILIRFARGQYIWRLEWQTQEPGVVQYHWTRSQQRFESERAAHEAGQWVDLSEEELHQYGGWVGQAVEGMVNRRERLASFSGAVGVCIDIIGSIAVGVFSSSLSGGTRAKPSPSQRGGRVIPLPFRPPAPASVKPPAASGM
jgi:hypothetical protein